MTEGKPEKVRIITDQTAWKITLPGGKSFFGNVVYEKGKRYDMPENSIIWPGVSGLHSTDHPLHAAHLLEYLPGLRPGHLPIVRGSGDSEGNGSGPGGRGRHRGDSLRDGVV